VTGIQGSQGLQGIQGFKGTEISISETAPASPEVNDLWWNSVGGMLMIYYYDGDSYQWVSATSGITGAQGTQGIQGLTGSQGIQGTAGTFGGAAFDYTFDTSTANSNPGSGKLRLNNADLSLADALYINENDDLNNSIYNFLQTIDDSTSVIKGHFTISIKGNADVFALFAISGTHSHGTNYFTVPASYLAGATSFASNADIVITFARTGDVGAQGTQGIQGIQGIQGLTGTQGAVGPQGAQGLQGIQGIQGVQGTQGTQGVQGVQGIQGAQGTQGTQGEQGIQGVQGIQGRQGTQGIQGLTGSQGSQGTIGSQGAQGIQGIQGTQGVLGSTGAQGAMGSQGTQGIQGIQGRQGITGANGTNGTNGAQGAQGSVGSTGSTGSTGAQGTSGATILGNANTWTATNYFNSNIVVGNGQASSTINMYDSDESTRYIHNNSSTIGFLGSAGNWRLRVADDGNVLMGTYQDWLSSQIRTGVMYDSADTGYYSDPNGTSNLATLNVNGIAYFRGGQGVDQCCGDDGTISIGGSSTRPPRISLHYSGVMEGTVEGSGTGWRKVYFYDQQGSGLGVHATGQIASNGNVIAYYSDRRLKKDFDKVTDHWNVINNLTGYRFTWNEKAGEIPGFIQNVGKREVGLIAQEVLAVYPEAVYTRTEGPENDKYKTIMHDRFTPVFIEALKELKQEIQNLKQENEELRALILKS
jgi:hypothetical protein